LRSRIYGEGTSVHSAALRVFPQCSHVGKVPEALLVIEHDVPLLLSISDRLIAFDLGEIVASGPPDEVVRDPVVVTSYLGTTEAAIARSGARGAS